jgi:tetraacyldisaccharide 4'-kinase
MNPLSAIFAMGVELRNEFYDRGVLLSRKLKAPVISVGSISAGGAGKTPFVILLGEFLNRNRVPFDVLSRGYGRRSRGVRVVHANGTPADYGDEPLLMTRRLGCPVVVGESRYEAGNLAEKQFTAQVHLLDDGFQHRALARDLDIVLLTAEDLRDTLLPLGRLREPLRALERADVIAAAEGVDLNKLAISGKTVWRVRRAIYLRGTPRIPVAFCGIARPQRFFDQLRAMGVQAVAHKIYPDHHAYSSDDVERLRELARRKHAEGFITTEKDATNLGPRLEELGEVTVAQVTMEVDPADALDTVLRLTVNREPQREKIRGQ